MSQSNVALERLIDDAMEALAEGLYQSVAAAARDYDVPARTLQRRMNGMGPLWTRPPTNRTLSEAQELAVCEYIDRLDSWEMSARPQMVERAANYLLSLDSSDRVVSPHWTRRFLNRHPEYLKRKPKTIAAQRKNAHNLKDMEEYFEKFLKLTELYGFEPEDTWNMDETTFRIGSGKAQWVITRDARKALVMQDPENRERITSTESINGGGHTIPAFLTLQAKYTLHKWTIYNDLSDEISLSISDSGHSNDSLAMAWLRHFEKHSARGQVGPYRLLIMDGYGSHLTYEFWSFAKEHKIILFRLPPHSTHLTQPLDVGCFQPFKNHHFQAMNRVVRLGDVEFGKLQFLAEFQAMRDKTFTEATIRSAWEKTGLIPFNPEMVLSKIRDHQDEQPTRPTTPPPQPVKDTILDRTPRSAREIVDQAEVLQRWILSGKKVNPKYLYRFIKGSTASAHSREIIEDELKSVQEHATVKAARKKIAGTVAKKGGVITVGEVRASFQAREQSELQKAEVAAQKAINALQRQKDLQHRKELGRLKKFWDVLKTNNQHHARWEKKQAKTHVTTIKKYRNRRK